MLELQLSHSVSFMYLQFKLKISDKSEVTQTIVLDAGCPYLKFETEVRIPNP